MNRTPVELKIAKGTFRKHRHANTPRIDAELPTKPAFLSARGGYWWKRLGSQLVKAKVLTPADASTFALHCDSLARFEEVTQLLKGTENCVTPTQMGTSQNALFHVRNKLFDQILKTGIEFGLTPASRTKVKTTQASKDDLGEWGSL